MYRIPAIALTIAVGWSWPATGIAQQVSGNVRPHPAASAHANALSGATNAARIEACSVATRRLVDNLEKGDARGAMANFDARLQGAMSARQLGEIWQSVNARLGTLVERRPVQNMLYRGMVIITQPLWFERGGLGLEVACNQEGQFAGLHLRPLGPAPAAAH